MIENALIQFGALGIVAYVVHQSMTKTEKAIRNNTEALIRFNDSMDIILPPIIRCSDEFKKKNR